MQLWGEYLLFLVFIKKDNSPFHEVLQGVFLKVIPVSDLFFMEELIVEPLYPLCTSFAFMLPHFSDAL